MIQLGRVRWWCRCFQEFYECLRCWCRHPFRSTLLTTIALSSHAWKRTAFYTLHRERKIINFLRELGWPWLFRKEVLGHRYFASFGASFRVPFSFIFFVEFFTSSFFVQLSLLMLLSLSFQLDLQFGQLTGIGEIPFAQLIDHRIGLVRWPVFGWGSLWLAGFSLADKHEAYFMI